MDVDELLAKDHLTDEELEFLEAAVLELSRELLAEVQRLCRKEGVCDSPLAAEAERKAAEVVRNIELGVAIGKSD